MFRSVCILSLLPAAAALNAAPRSVASPAAQAALARLPLRFEANQGQFDPSVRYLARTGNYTLLLTSHGPVYSIPGAPRIGVTLVNSNPSAAIDPTDPVAERTDYYLGGRENWHTGIHNYAKVRYRSVYPGVDMVYYGSRDLLEYDFLLQPGADPDAIAMRFEGSPEVSLSKEGDLVLEIAGRRLVQRKPYVYQVDASGERREIAGSYRLTAGAVRLQLGRYDRSRPLVVDPVIQYCTYLGGPGVDRINASKLLPNGLLYLVGQTDSGQIPYINGAYNNDYTGLTDIFLQIIDTSAAGNFQAVYSSYIGGASVDVGTALDVDSKGIFYVTGYTTSTDFPMAGNSYQPTGAGTNQAAFVFQLDPAGYGGVSLLYSSYLSGTTGSDAGAGIAVDSKQIMYIVGTARSSDFPISLSAYQSDLWGPQDLFIAQMDPNAGTLLYSSYMGGEDADFACCIALGPNNLVYFAASTFSQNFAMAGFNYSASSFGGEDAVFGVMDLTKQGNASLVWSTYLGGSSNDAVAGMALDPQGNILLTGYTISNNFPHTPDAVQANYNGDTDAWVAALNPGLAQFPTGSGPQSLVYSSYLGGSGGDAGSAIASDANGNIFVTGYTLSPNFPIGGQAPQTTWPGGGDIFLTELKRGVAGPGGVLFSTYLGATANYMPLSVAVGGNGTMFVLGYSGLGLPTSAASAQGGYAGGISDGFILVVGTPAPAPATQTETAPRHRTIFKKRSEEIHR